MHAMNATASQPVDPASVLLAEQALFQGLSPAELAELGAAVHSREILPGRCIYRAGEASDGLYLVVAGTLEVVKREESEEGGMVEERVLGRLGPGDLFGEGALLGSRQHTAEVRALEPTRFLVIPRPVLDDFFERHPSRRLRLRTLSVTRRLANVSAAFVDKG